MQSSDLLEAIWRGDVACAGDTDAATGFGRILDRIMPMRRVELQRGDRTGGQVLPEQTELMPALALGDVIEEELERVAPYGALVVILDRAALRPGAGEAARSRLAGRLAGELLIDAVQRGAFPVEHETDALYLLALSYDALAHSETMHRMGLIAAPFRAGLAEVLADYWIGASVPGSDAARLLGGSIFLGNPRLRDYLAAMDASFTAPSVTLADAALIDFEGRVRGHDDWLRAIGARVAQRLRPESVDAAARH
jgi:hypothetical protein